MEIMTIISIVIFAALVATIFYQFSPKKSTQKPRHEPHTTYIEEEDDDILFEDLPKKRLVKTQDIAEDFEEDVNYDFEREIEEAEKIGVSQSATSPSIYTLYVMAAPQQAFHGYELLQALLAEDLRYGEFDIFHRYAHLNRRGEVIFSVASATEPGSFNIQNMGAVSVKGLCLFARLTGTDNDEHVMTMMLETAQCLADALEGTLLDQYKQPMDKAQCA